MGGYNIIDEYPREYRAWENAKRRCSNPHHPRYSRYGGRGVTMCERWQKSFPAFIHDMGRCPEGLTLDRINNDGSYEPDNCRWATVAEQNVNRHVPSQYKTSSRKGTENES